MGNTIKLMLFKLIGGLFLEEKSEDASGNPVWVSSMGRVAFWVVFIHMVVRFAQEKVVSSEEMNTFYALLGYQGVKVGKDAIQGTAEVFKKAPAAPGVTPHTEPAPAYGGPTGG